MANRIPKEIKEKIKAFVERFAKEYSDSGIASLLALILEDLSQETEGFENKISKYVIQNFQVEMKRLPNPEANASETHLGIMQDFLRVLEERDANILDYVGKRESAIRYKGFLEQKIKLEGFSKEWSGIMFELQELSDKEVSPGDGHDCANCSEKDSCSGFLLEQHLIQTKGREGSKDLRSLLELIVRS